MSTEPNDKFDHEQHVKQLEEASRELRRSGKHDHLAGAVDRAIMFHHEFVSRIHAARNTQDQLRRLADKLHVEARSMGEHVTKEGLPWTSRLKAFIWPVH